MVLLTASTISAGISGAVICLFTFLLFLSGYALQQKSVRSLQEALAAPIEVRVRVQPTLPPQFRHTSEENELTSGQDANITSDELVNPGNEVQIFLDGQPTDPVKKPSPKDLWRAYILEASNDPESSDLAQAEPLEPARPLLGRYAYVLILVEPADLCSALVFAKSARDNSHIPEIQLNLVFIYPSDWETTANPIYSDALRLLLQAEHKHSVLLHPAPISKVWAGIDAESQLLSELARNPWPYDRVMYLRSPGILLDQVRLDNTLINSYAQPSSLKTGWTKLRAPTKRGAAIHPDMLLFAQGKGLMIPVGDQEMALTARANSDQALAELTSSMLDPGYLLFDKQDVESSSGDLATYSSLLTYFNGQRSSACEGTNLLASA